MPTIEELIQQDPSEDNRYAAALTELQKQVADSQAAIDAANEAIKQKSEAIQQLKASNFDLLSKLTAEEKKPTIEKESRSTVDVLKNLYK